jgi:predicted nucleic acid-binding protein
MILLDTTIYIDTLYGATPPEVDDLLRNRPKVHLSVVIAELSHWFGSSSRSVPGTEEALEELAGTIADIAP